MTSEAQDFKTYAGDGAVPIFTVRDGAGVVIDISTVSQIQWTAQRTLASAAVVSKTKTGGGITFVTNGTDGKFQVALTSADTAALSGFYLHQAIVTDGLSNVSTVATGRMQVGRAPVWTYSGDPSLSTRDAVRFWIRDTDSSTPQLMDPEIDYVLTQFANPMLAAAQCCRNLQSKYAAKPSKSVGDLSISWGEVAKQYDMLAKALEARGNTFGLQPYSGGISWADRFAVDSDSDRVRPPFKVNQFDNPSGNNNTSDSDWDTGPVQ